jgi:1,4-dihydroxy-2-naphthoate octaprenyltransferase
LAQIDRDEVAGGRTGRRGWFGWLGDTRASWLTATFVPMLLAAAWTPIHHGQEVPTLNLALVLFTGLAAHVVANLVWDGSSWRPGPSRERHRFGSAGAGEADEPGASLSREALPTAVAMVVVAVACVAGLAALVGPGVAVFGLVGLASTYYYAVPPIRLADRKGVGELFLGLHLGPVMTSGTVYALTGTFAPMDLVVGLPLGLLMAAVPWMDELRAPRREVDADEEDATDRHLVEVIGERTARWGYVALVAGAFGILGAGAAAGTLPAGMLVATTALPVAAFAVYRVVDGEVGRPMTSAYHATIAVQIASGLAMAAGLWWNETFAEMIPL